MGDEKRIKPVDIGKLKHSGKIVSSEEALKDVIPIDWSEEVLRGEKKVIIDVDIDGLVEHYMSLNYRIEIVKDEAEEGYAVQYPELRGCVTCAEDIPAVIENLEDAKREWLRVALEDGYPVTEPGSNEFLISYRGYTGNIEFTEEDQVFHGRLIGIKDSVSYEGENIGSLAGDFCDAVDDYTADRQQKLDAIAERIIEKNRGAFSKLTE